MAVGLPFLARGLASGNFPVAELIPDMRYATFVVTANLLLIPVALYLAKTSSALRMAFIAGSLGAGATAFFAFPLA